MSRSIRRGAVAATLALALAPLAAACSSGTDAATTKVKPDTANVKVGTTIKVQNLMLVTGDEGSGLVALGGAFVNDGDQPETLTKVTLEGAAGPAELHTKDGAGPIVIPAHGAVYLTGGENTAVFEEAEAKEGDYKDVTLSFSTVGEAKLGVAVHAPEEYFAQLKPTADPAQVPSAAPSTSPSVSPSAPATPTGAPTATAPVSGSSATPGVSGAPTNSSTASGAPTNSASRAASGTPAES